MASYNYDPDNIHGRNDDYYNYGNQSREPLHHHSPSPASQIDPRYPPSSQPTPAPSYHTNYPPPSVAPYPPTIAEDPVSRTGPSPFDTVFDDHVYPVNPQHPAAAASTSDMSQHYYPQDTGYHGQHGQQPQSSLGPGAYGRGGAYGSSGLPGSTDDIPLQDRHHKDAPDPEAFNDHVYDDPNGAGGRRRKSKKRKKVGLGQLGMFGSDKKGIPWVTYLFTVVQIAVFIGEIVNNGIKTGSPIMIKPQFNYMIGPSTYIMIEMGARYVPCMKNLDEIQGSNLDFTKGPFLCPNATTTEEKDVCPLSVACGFGGNTPNPDPSSGQGADQDPRPNQWWRFIVPMFMHAGLIHIAFNMLLQLTLGREMEQAIGSIRYGLVYVSAGIFGFVMGGVLSAPFQAVTGASGSLFGVIALTLLDLLYSWRERKSPVKDLLFILVDIIISFVLGLLPGLDNFSHIGGFLMGLALGISVLHSPNALRMKIGQDVAYSTVPEGSEGPQAFFKNPIGFFKGRKPLWWVWWLVRAGALVLVIIVFSVLLNTFYTTTDEVCSWCKYLSCLPVSDWCEAGTLLIRENDE